VSTGVTQPTGAAESLGGPELAAAEAELVADVGPKWWQIILSSGKAKAGVIILAAYILVAVLAPVIAPYKATRTDFDALLVPSSQHLLGTTTAGGDIFSQLIWGSQVSLLVGLFGGTFATVVAMLIGMVSGYFEGSWVDDVLSFITNVALVVPVLPLIIVLMAYTEVRTIWFTIFIIGITSWAGAARAKRSQIITLRNRDFVTAAKFAGESTLTIIFREIMPSMIGLVMAGFFGAAVGAIGAEAGLSFLGLGDTSSVSWGTMLYQAQLQGALAQGLWLWLVIPGLMLSGLIMAFTLINFGIDLIANPHLREGS
jgi:peptide/nickel transport system permease protein